VEVHAFPILDRKGNLIQVIEYSIDITERKKLEEELKESEKRYRILVNTLGEGVALADPDERFVFANPEAERIFGVPPAGLTGRNLKEFLPPDQISKVLFETGKRTNEEQSTYEIDIITPGNQLRHLLLTATPLLGEEGKYIAALGIFRNITEQKQMEAEIATFTRELQESNATKDKFFSIIAHDLKNPFNAILGLTDLITEELHTLNKETIQNIIHTIKTSSENAFRLLENLMIWANSQTGKIECHPEPIHLQRSIHEIISLLQGQASVKNIRIFSQCEEEYQASGDKQMIQTVLRNLLSNAIKFTPQGGGIKISVIPRDQEYEISVQDTGLGIPAEDLPKLFRIDSKYSTRGTANEKGTGLGLVLCKEFVEKNGGTLNVTSETGKGSTFSFTLPGNIAYEKEKTD